MKQFILLFSLLLSTFCGFAQNEISTLDLISSTWKIDKIVGLDSANINEFVLEPVDRSNRFWMWGNTIKFGKDSIFTCDYSAPCGNDCFPSSTGIYTIIDSLRIQLRLKEIQQRGDCHNFEKTLITVLGTYQIEKQDSVSYSLIKL